MIPVLMKRLGITFGRRIAAWQEIQRGCAWEGSGVEPERSPDEGYYLDLLHATPNLCPRDISYTDERQEEDNMAGQLEIFSMERYSTALI